MDVIGVCCKVVGLRVSPAVCSTWMVVIDVEMGARWGFARIVTMDGVVFARGWLVGVEWSGLRRRLPRGRSARAVFGMGGTDRPAGRFFGGANCLTAQRWRPRWQLVVVDGRARVA